MSKLTAVKIKYDDNNLSEQIPIGVQAENVQVGSKNLPNTLTTINNTLNTLNNKINNIKFDKTLSQSGQGADAQATRELINEVKNDLMDLIDKLPFITALDESEMDQWNQDKIYRLNNKLYIYQGTSWKPIQTSIPKSIKSTSVSADYRLRIDFTDDTFWRSQPINVGRKGTSITQVSVDKAASQLIFHFDAPVIIGYDEDETPITATRASFEIAQGPPGPRGPEGRGISNIMMDEDKHLIISYDDGTAPYQSSTSLEGVGITDVDINNQDYLVLTFSDGSTHTVEKSIRGPQGVGISNVDIDENDCLEVTYTNNSTYTIQNKPLRGAEGKGISQAGLDENNHLFMEYTDGTQYTSEQSLKGDPIHLYDQVQEFIGLDLDEYKEIGCLHISKNDALRLTHSPCKDTFVLYITPIKTTNPKIISQTIMSQKDQVYTRIFKQDIQEWSDWKTIEKKNTELKELTVTRENLTGFYNTTTGLIRYPDEANLLEIPQAPSFIKKNQILTFECDKPKYNFSLTIGKGFFYDAVINSQTGAVTCGTQEVQKRYQYNSETQAYELVNQNYSDTTYYHRFTQTAYNTSKNVMTRRKPYHGNWIQITPTWVYDEYYDGASGTKHVVKLTDSANVKHNLDLKNATHIKVIVEIQKKQTCLVKIETDLGSFSTCFTATSADWAYTPFVYTSIDVSNVKFTYSCPDLRSPVWLFGDSYLNFGSDRVLDKLLAKDKFKNVCVCALGGAQAVETQWQALTEVEQQGMKQYAGLTEADKERIQAYIDENLQKGCPPFFLNIDTNQRDEEGNLKIIEIEEKKSNGDYHKSLSLDLKKMVNMGYLPKYIIWAVGENTDFPATRADWDKSELTQAQKQEIKDNEDKDTIYHLENILIPFCQKHNIELILYKPPSVPKLAYKDQIFHTKLHEKLRELRDQGYKVIDAHGAVRVSFTEDTYNNATVSDRLVWGNTLAHASQQQPYINTGDGVHPSTYGSQAIANVYDDLEFEFL